MQPWLTRPKFPVLRVRVVGDNLTITQQPYSFFTLSQRDATSGADSTPSADTTRHACEEGADGGRSEEAGAGSPGSLRTGATVPDGRSLEGRTSAVDVQEYGAATQERPQPSRAAWPIPLRIRAGTGVRPVSNGPPAHAVEAEDGESGGRSNGHLGEETRSFLLAETSTSVVLRGLACGPAADVSGEGTTSAEGRETLEIRGGNQESGRERRPYLVMNDGHSGFFTVQYECERSWELALAAVDEGVLNECETMGFVHDLILPLHEGVLIDRRAASSSISSRKESCGGGGEGPRCDVTCLFSRLEKVVKVLGRDRGHPAWSTGQLFMWEILIMCASNELGDMYELSSEIYLAQKRLRDSCEQRCAEAAAAPTWSDDGVVAGDEGGAESRHAAGSSPTMYQGADSTSTLSPGTETAGRAAVVAGDSSVEERGERGTVAASDALSAMEGRVAAAAQRLRSITADVELASEEAEEHVRWHADQVASGVQQASEALQSLREMRDRLERSRAQLAWWARQHETLKDVV